MAETTETPETDVTPPEAEDQSNRLDHPENGEHEEELGPGAVLALQRERAARKAAEKALDAQKKTARDAQRKADALEREKLSDTQKLEREAAEGRELAATAATQLREAHLLTALTGTGLTGTKAKAAIKLLDGLEYDDDHEPTNLDDRIEAAKAEYGDELFTGATPSAPPPPEIPAPEENDHTRPDTHQGPRRDADDPDLNAEYDAYMKQHFPHAVGADS